MNSSDTSTPQPERIESHRVPQSARLGTLPRHFGQRMHLIESRIYRFMCELVPAYDGGLWDFFELSNGGFYMIPPGERWHLSVLTNGYDGELSADAAGITVCLFTFSHLSFGWDPDLYVRHFYWLREFALQHPESAEIFAAID